MLQREIPWSGHDLMPLPYESVLSCLLRLAWRNALNEVDLRRHFSGFKNTFHLDLDALFEQTKWYLDRERVSAFEREIEDRHSIWLTDQFRFCAICLECGYHADLFQCQAITACSYHHVRLSTKCQCCGEPTPHYKVAKALFHNPYYCHRCRSPLAGAAPSLEAHLDLRAAAPQLQAALRPYEDWWQEMHAQRQRLTTMQTTHWPPLQAQWCDPVDFLRAVACRNRHLPPYVALPRYDQGHIVILAWRYRVSLGSVDAHFRPRASWSERVKTVMGVYRCTLRLLGCWIARRHGWSPSEFTELMHTDRGYQVQDYPVDLLAFLFMRWQLERRFSEFPDFDSFPIDRAQLHDRPTVAMNVFHQRTPRLGWRAIFLAIYASWHGRIASGQFQDLRDLRNRINWDEPYIFARNEVPCRLGTTWNCTEIFNPDEAWYEGEVCFLKIDDMPLRPWIDAP